MYDAIMSKDKERVADYVEKHLHNQAEAVKKLIRELKKTNPYVEKNIFRSVENVNLNTIVAYKENGVTHSFLEGYDEK